MPTRQRICLILLLMLCVSGCATVLKQAPPDRVLAFQTPTSDKSAKLTVIRPFEFAGGGCYKALYVNTIFAARLDVDEFAHFYVDPGEVLLRIGRDPYGKGGCSFDQDNWIQRETFLKPSDNKTFRIKGGDIQRADQ